MTMPNRIPIRLITLGTYNHSFRGNALLHSLCFCFSAGLT